MPKRAKTRQSDNGTYFAFEKGSKDKERKRHKGQFTSDDPRRYRGGGKPRVRNIATLLKKFGEEPDDVTFTDKTKLEAMLARVYREALHGEAWAVYFIAERTEGKVQQVIKQEEEDETLKLSDAELTLIAESIDKCQEEMLRTAKERSDARSQKEDEENSFR